VLENLSLLSDLMRYHAVRLLLLRVWMSEAVRAIAVRSLPEGEGM
jgi:hypothetical protein